MYQLASNVRSGKSPRRSGLTLIELLIAVTLTLVIIAVMVRAFKLTSDEIGVGRAKMDMHNQLRTVTETLRRDLQMATCLPRPRGLNDERTGYFEYVEGDERDLDHLNVNTNSFVGDHDDVLALTIRSDEKPFRGRFATAPGGYVESNLAEVCWWVVHDDTNGDNEVQYDENVRLYRRVLLIRPDLTTTDTDIDLFYVDNDVSVRLNPPGTGLLMNSLEDLAERRNRYAHDTVTFPNEIDSTLLEDRVFAGDIEGEDLMLSGCSAFDIKVFDPNAEVAFIAGTDYLLDSNDPGFAPGSMPITTTGGYVDLGFGVTHLPTVLNGWFAGASYPDNLAPPVAPAVRYGWSANTWCSWWAGYEFDGVSQNDDNQNGVIGDPGDLIDEGANGVDDYGSNGIDDDMNGLTDAADPKELGIDGNLERETQPPYPYPIRSIQISVRMIEKKTNQVLQKTIKESFVPN